MAGLAVLDIVVFVSYMLLLVGIGVWFTRQQKGLESYLLADKNIHWIIVAVSVLAALFSGITYLGAPAECFFFDLRMIWLVASFLLATPITTILFIPVFRNQKFAQFYTAYEYLEHRFDCRLRWIASGLFIVRGTFFIGLVMYAPALALAEVTGWPLTWSILLTGVAATLYTTLGGMKAVIWTDTIQFMVLCGGVVLILAIAISAVPGGLPVLWQKAAEDGKTRVFNFSFDPTIRVTFWGALIGGAFHGLVQMVTDQISVQRYLTAPSLADARRAMWFKLWITVPLVPLFYLLGIVLYGYYKTVPPERVPLVANAQLVPHLPQIKREDRLPIANDQILPYFVVNELPSPLPGLLIAAVFGATIAVVSAGINALATATLMDFGSTLVSDNWGVYLARWLTNLFGFLGLILALFVMPLLGPLIQAVISILGIFGGPLLGLFFLAVLSRRAGPEGAIIGLIAGAGAGALVFWSKTLFGFEISFLWISLTSCLTTYFFGSMASQIFPAPSFKQLALTIHAIDFGKAK